MITVIFSFVMCALCAERFLHFFRRRSTWDFYWGLTLGMNWYFFILSLENLQWSNIS
jgi:hypothetical protein